MRHSGFKIFAIVVVVLGIAPSMFGDTTDYMLNLNGSTYCPSGTGAACTHVLGSYNLVAPGTVSTLDTSFGGTGLGTVGVTFNPGAAGTYNVNLWLFEQLFPPVGDDEYGATGGTATANQAGLSWQIDVPDYEYVSGFDPNFGGLPAGAGSIIANTAASTLANTNYLPGNSSQFSFSCSGSPTCNDYTSMALGFNFTLSATQEETLSFTVSTKAPASGFYLEQIAPVDPANTSEIDYFYTATASTSSSTGPPPPVIPEPGSIFLLAPVAVFLWFLRFRSRSAAVNEK